VYSYCDPKSDYLITYYREKEVLQVDGWEPYHPQKDSNSFAPERKKRGSKKQRTWRGQTPNRILLRGRRQGHLSGTASGDPHHRVSQGHTAN
jgi:hypothetical protein